MFVEKGQESLAQQRQAKIDTPEARESYGRRLASVEPVFGNLRAQKRLERFTVRGKIKGSTQGMLYSLVHNIEKLLHYGRAVERGSRGGLQPP